MKKINILIAFCLYCFCIEAQVVTQKTEPDFIDELLQIEVTESIPSVYLPDLSNQEVSTLEAEDQENDLAGGPWRFAKLIDTDFSINSSGVLQLVGDYWVWVLKIETDHAQSLSLTFQELQLTEGAEIYLFTEDKNILYGPLTKEMFTPGEDISTEVLPGNSIFVYYRVPKSSEVIDNILISKVGFGYRSGGSAFNNLGVLEDRVLSCHVDVTGTNGDCFRMEQRAVARTLVDNSASLCTATLINNTNSQNDLRPFLITANHCSFPSASAPNEINFANLGIRFLYYQGNSTIITFIGANQRVATGAISD